MSFDPINNKSAISNSNFAKESEQTKQSFLNTRKVELLPAAKWYRSEWEKMGIVWREFLDNKTVLAPAFLPEGWELRSDPKAATLDYYILYDNENMPKVLISIKDTLYERSALARFLGKEESERMHHDEMKMKEEKIKKEILKIRSEVWSEQCPFAVFFIKDTSDIMWGYVRGDKKYFCHGFFSTQDLANEAKELLLKDANPRDILFVHEVEKNDPYFQQNRKIENGFINKDWYYLTLKNKE